MPSFVPNKGMINQNMTTQQDLDKALFLYKSARTAIVKEAYRRLHYAIVVMNHRERL